MSNPEKGNHIDLSSEAPATDKPEQNKDSTRSFLGVRFICCDFYSRIYLNKQQTAYVGNCPKCAKQAHIRIGEGGTNARFFEVG